MAGEMTQLAQTSIGKAIENGNCEELKKLIAARDDILFKDRKGNTYLHYVCTMYRPYILHILAASGIDVNAQNRHGNTALHITAIREDFRSLADILAVGVDPLIKNKDGKTAAELNIENKYWHDIYEKYKPGLFRATENRDKKRVVELLNCWCKTDISWNRQTLRQYAASLKFHDIVWLFDEHKATMDVIYGVMEKNYNKISEALKKSKCNVNLLNKASHKQHILQHAIKMNDEKMVNMLCDAGASVNIQVLIKEYFWGPLYFEAFGKEVSENIMWRILKANPDLSLKDERGRNAMMYAMDKHNGKFPIKVFEYLLTNGTYIGDRDKTGVTVRDIAKFSRRKDVVALVEKSFIKLIQESNMEKLHELAVNGYDGFDLQFNHRDSYIYASGNETDEVLKFIEYLPTFPAQVKHLHLTIKANDMFHFKSILSESEHPEMLLNSKDKGGRTPLILAVLYNSLNIVKEILQSDVAVRVNEFDNCCRTAYHYVCAYGESHRELQKLLEENGADPMLQDTKARKGVNYEEGEQFRAWLEEERLAIYGMEMELSCMRKYEELRKIIKSKSGDLEEFLSCVKPFNFPVSAFHKKLCLLVPDYKDLIFLAVDFKKEDIIKWLADFGADLCRKEKYKTREGSDSVSRDIYLDVVERAQEIGLHGMSSYLFNKRQSAVQDIMMGRLDVIAAAKEI